ncbi:unnamed protein product [Paramecium sonneborni]|uniref:Uncharacterized protein n=1 Tax=Paramecium sonneborni TaxID=65129 RepID=A0A8S1Q8L7_9CILI|nr:unnamed protein product [Paramecium sonneborni]
MPSIFCIQFLNLRLYKCESNQLEDIIQEYYTIQRLQQFEKTD